MEIISLFKDFAKKLQKTALIKEYDKAKKQVERDKKLQELIEEFNLKKADLNYELAKDERDEEKTKGLNSEVRSLYESIIENNSMKEFNEIKVAVDKLVKDINFILIETINGVDPYSVDPDMYSSCAGSCGSCSGCCN